MTHQQIKELEQLGRAGGEYEAGRRDSALVAAKLIRVSDWTRAERRRLRCLVSLMHGLRVRPLQAGDLDPALERPAAKPEQDKARED